MEISRDERILEEPLVQQVIRELDDSIYRRLHRDIFLGPERAARISPAASAEKRGIRFTTHLDTPVVPIDSMLQLWTPVVRMTSSGQTLGAEERISVEHSLRALTLDAAWQMRIEDEVGSIEPGKKADLVILSKNPLENESDLRGIRIEQTVVGGVTVYDAGTVDSQNGTASFSAARAARTSPRCANMPTRPTEASSR